MTTPGLCLRYLIIAMMLVCAIEGRIVRAVSEQSATVLNSDRGSSQFAGEKIIEKDTYGDEPVEIEALAVKNVKIALRQKFSAKSVAEQGGGQEEDWLENLELTLKNKSDKRITYLSISLRFPLFGSPDPSVGMFYHFVSGVDPRATGTAATHAEPLSLDVGESYAVRLSDKGLREIKQRLTMSKNSLADVNKVFLRISTVGYEDGGQWQLGRYSLPEKQQPSDKKVVEKAEYNNEPCEIGDLSVKGVRVLSQERLVSNGFTKVRRDSYEFSAESVAGNSGGQKEDWLENLKLTIKNKSDQQINYIGLAIQFPETEVNGPVMVYSPPALGIHPKAATVRMPQSTPLALAPGDTTTFALSASQLKLMKDFLALRKFQLGGLNRAVIRLETVTLEDGKMWSTGHYYKPNSSAVGGYERVDQ
jgi:hypothetical protein